MTPQGFPTALFLSKDVTRRGFVWIMSGNYANKLTASSPFLTSVGNQAKRIISDSQKITKVTSRKVGFFSLALATIQYTTPWYCMSSFWMSSRVTISVKFTVLEWDETESNKGDTYPTLRKVEASLLSTWRNLSTSGSMVARASTPPRGQCQLTEGFLHRTTHFHKWFQYTYLAQTSCTP